MRLRHMGPPMLPTPIYPTFIASSVAFRSEHYTASGKSRAGHSSVAVRKRCRDTLCGRFALRREGAGRKLTPALQEGAMPDASNGFTDMFKQFGEQLKVPAFDASKIMEHHQKNIEAMSR